MIGSFPIGRVDVETEATPLASVEVPNVVDPLEKVTVPVTPIGSDALKATNWLASEGFTEDVRVTTGVALVTV